MKAGIDYTGICVVFYYHDGDGNLLMHKRSAACRDENHRWDCGSGQLEFGENPEQGVLREIMEEYGCAGTIEKKLEPVSIIRTQQEKKTHWLAIPFIIKVNKDEVSINEPEAMDDIGWFSLHQLPSPLHSSVEWYIPQIMPELKQLMYNKETA